MMKLGVGMKWAAIAAVVLVAGLTLFLVTQFIQEAERDKVTVEIQDKQIERRVTIDRGVEEQRSKTAEESLNYLGGRGK